MFASPELVRGLADPRHTVIARPYREEIYWFWGGTDKVDYPLGYFGASGAYSETPGSGGLDHRANQDFIVRDTSSDASCCTK